MNIQIFMKLCNLAMLIAYLSLSLSLSLQPQEALAVLDMLTREWPKEPELYISKGKVIVYPSVSTCIVHQVMSRSLLNNTPCHIMLLVESAKRVLCTWIHLPHCSLVVDLCLMCELLSNVQLSIQ